MLSPLPSLSLVLSLSLFLSPCLSLSLFLQRVSPTISLCTALLISVCSFLCPSLSLYCSFYHPLAPYSPGQYKERCRCSFSTSLPPSPLSLPPTCLPTVRTINSTLPMLSFSLSFPLPPPLSPSPTCLPTVPVNTRRVVYALALTLLAGPGLRRVVTLPAPCPYAHVTCLAARCPRPPPSPFAVT